MAAQEFITQLLQLGVGGIDLKRALDLISPLRLSRMTNLTRNVEGRLTTRPGQRRLAWAPGGLVHSIGRLQTVLAGGEFVRLVGVDSALFRGAEGGLTEVARDFSGQPMSLVPGHPPLSGDAWMYVGDSARMVKVRGSDGLVMPIGLAPPTAVPVVSVGTDHRTPIEAFDTTTGWTPNAGTGGLPAAPVVPASIQGKTGLGFVSSAGAATGGYYNFWIKRIDPPIDLSVVTGVTGEVEAADEDQVHTWVLVQHPSRIEEIRIYLIVANETRLSLSILPGTDENFNTDAYVKSFIPAIFTPLVETQDPSNQALATGVALRQLEEALEAQIARQGGAQLASEQQDEIRGVAARRLSLGQGQWTEFGVPGMPLRRGEFLRIGSDLENGWEAIRGIAVYVKTSVPLGTGVRLDDMFLRGGFAPDTSEPTSVAYDYRYRHTDPRTGAKSRWSPVMEDSTKIDVVRQAVRLVPQAYGDPAIRQEFSRRGGTIPSDWHFVGRNWSDGGCALDRTSDAEALATGTELDTDFHQPVTTVDVDGDAVFAQPLPVIFGPAPGGGFLLGLGDPYRPGHIYWSLPDQYDHWPLGNNAEVCSPDEELMNGGIFGGQAFAFSRLRLYPLLISVVDNRVRPQASTCAKGLVARSAMVVGLDGIYFVAADGVYRTTGGTPQSLTDDFIEPLFRGERKNGYAPVDFNAASTIRLHLHLNELWLLFQDIDGRRQAWIYSLIFQFWRHAEFGWPVACLSSEEFDRPQLLMGAAASGRVYLHEGTHDDGLAIAARGRTGALHMSLPRQDKLYGDVELEADLQGVVATVETYKNQESGLVSTRVVAPLVGPQVYLIDAFGSTPLQAKDVSIDFSWTALGTSPSVGRGGPSFIPQPESALGRVTEWDELGSGANKLIKGVLIEANTFGYQKVFNVVVDGGTTPVATFTLQTQGRQFQHVAFDSQIEGRIVRLVPTDNAPWLPYEIRWMFDTDPLELTRWETQETDHGIPTTQTLSHGYVTLRSTAEVLLSITARREDGTTALGSVTIASTGGQRRKFYVRYPMLKALLFKYVFTSSAPFRLFREESVVYTQPWGAEQAIPVQPFGSDNLDAGRVLRDAEGAALRGARWLDTSARMGQQG